MVQYTGIRDTPADGFGPSPSTWAVRAIDAVQVTAGPAARVGSESEERHLRAMQRFSPADGWRAKADLLLATQHVTTVPSYRPFRPHVLFDDADSPAYSGFTPQRLHTCRRVPRRPPVRGAPQPHPVPPSGRRTKLGVMMSPLDSHGLMMPTLGSPISRGPPADCGGIGWSAAVESKRGRPAVASPSYVEEDTPPEMMAVHQLHPQLRLPQDYL
eukprot:COSAG05_NODE_4273_length_1587_cov_10.487231_3_plen_214_part_00